MALGYIIPSVTRGASGQEPGLVAPGVLYQGDGWSIDMPWCWGWDNWNLGCLAVRGAGEASEAMNNALDADAAEAQANISQSNQVKAAADAGVAQAQLEQTQTQTQTQLWSAVPIVLALGVVGIGIGGYLLYRSSKKSRDLELELARSGYAP